MAEKTTKEGWELPRANIEPEKEVVPKTLLAVPEDAEPKRKSLSKGIDERVKEIIGRPESKENSFGFDEETQERANIKVKAFFELIRQGEGGEYRGSKKHLMRTLGKEIDELFVK